MSSACANQAYDLRTTSYHRGDLTTAGLDYRKFGVGTGITRRNFLELLAGGLTWLAASPLSALATDYRVGVGHLADPYSATMRAVEACGEWPGRSIAGRTVVIKPSLVSGMPAETGVTTEPEVVRALVDLALQSEARQIFIVESAVKGANFSLCGYDFFTDYDLQGRVSLIDLDDWPIRLYRVAGGMAYGWLYMPKPLMGSDVVFISVPTLKCHTSTLVTLSMKNLFGLPPWRLYRASFIPGRFGMHKRGVHQTIVDLNLVRQIDFAVVDAIWAMEGDGPWNGNPVKMDFVLAGSNALAVDRVCLMAMDIAQNRVQHLEYAATKGLGPSDMDMIEVVGDPLPSHSFVQPDIPPQVDAPTCTPKVFSPGAGQYTIITYRVDRACWSYAEIVRTWDIGPSWVRRIRTLHGWKKLSSGTETLIWDGRDDDGILVFPARYTVRIRATASRSAYATGHLWVKA